MTYDERKELNKTLANQAHYNAIAVQPTNTATATIIGVDGQTGRAIANVADGIARYQNIASSNQLGITSSAFSGKFSDGRSG